MQNIEENEILLKEIIMTPSAEIKENRFADAEASARCHGTCDSGACKALV